MKALTTNETGKYYKLINDIWFNQDLIMENGNISDTGVAWDHDGNKVKGWKAHLDGDSHAIRGLYASRAFSLLGNIGEGASIENTAFVDCAVKTELHASGDGGFLAREQIGAKAEVNNCLFDGLYYRLGTGNLYIGGLCWSFGGEYAKGNLPTIKDCGIGFQVCGHCTKWCYRFVLGGQ